MKSKQATTKVCPVCTLPKNETEFGKANRRGGLRSYCKECEKDYQKNRLNILKEKIFDKLGHVCCKCGFADKRALQIDHRNGGGNQEHKKVKNHESFLNLVLRDVDNRYQILCANCNWIKRIENRENPKDNTIPEQSRQKMSEIARRRVVPEETKQRQSASHLGKIPWNKGKIVGSFGNTWTEEQKRRHSLMSIIREAAKTPEQRSESARKREANKRLKKQAEITVLVDYEKETE